MKKILSLLLVACLLCALCACGSKEKAVPAVQDTVVEATPEPVAVTPETAATAQPVIQQSVATPVPAEPEDNSQQSRPDSGNSGAEGGNTEAEGGETVDRYALAQSNLGLDADSFRSIVGAPSSTEYTISCQAEGAEDGVWYYDSFVVWTLRMPDGTETVVDCDAY